VSEREKSSLCVWRRPTLRALFELFSSLILVVIFTCI